MDASSLRLKLEKLDAALEAPAELVIRGGAAMLLLGFEGRVTIDIDVLPTSCFVESDLRRACEAAGLAWNPPDKDFPPGDYMPEQTLVLPAPSPDGAPYNTVFRGRQLTVRTPPAADLAVGKLKRLGPEDAADVQFLILRHGLDAAALREAFARLPARFRSDPVLTDNLRYVLQDHWGEAP